MGHAPNFGAPPIKGSMQHAGSTRSVVAAPYTIGRHHRPLPAHVQRWPLPTALPRPPPTASTARPLLAPHPHRCCPDQALPSPSPSRPSLPSPSPSLRPTLTVTVLAKPHMRHPDCAPPPPSQSPSRPSLTVAIDILSEARRRRRCSRAPPLPSQSPSRPSPAVVVDVAIPTEPRRRRSHLGRALPSPSPSWPIPAIVRPIPTEPHPRHHDCAPPPPSSSLS